VRQHHLISAERPLGISGQRGIWAKTLDVLDKKILQNLSVGTSSYEELAKTCNVSRNTVYRRIAALENKGIIKNIIQCSINLEQLDITPITIGAKILQAEQEKAVRLLSVNSHVRLLMRTYGDSNVSMILFCSKGKEGEIIQRINLILEECNATCVNVSVGISWEKMDLTPFDDKSDSENGIKRITKIEQLQLVPE
jgi:DNA-binding Lrp family transcriptional regulator